ncbi:MAG: FAD-dependent oxidoreductase [Waterburya sp.]
MSIAVKNVAIIGAGLGGLACAIALRKQDIKVQVYEKAKKMRPAGAGLGLLPNGFNSLEAIDPDLVKKIKSSGCYVSKSTLRILEGPICDRLPLSSWSKGRVTLLGDAAHPMGPAMGKGANTAFEDACELANCISQSSGVEEAFASYEKKRLERTKFIQTRSAAREMHYYETDEQRAKREATQDSQANEELRQWLYGYKPSAVI